MQTINNQRVNRGKLLHSNWKAFVLGDLFDAKRPIARKGDDYIEGEIPFVASGGINNGVTKFCEPKAKEILDKGNCLTVSPVDGSCYYQENSFLGRGGAGSSIIILYAKNFVLDRYNALFISQAIKKTMTDKYSYGRMASIDRIKRDKILLPANTKGTPDFQFMSLFMKQIETDILGTTLTIFKDRVKDNQLNINKLGGVNWSVFRIGDIFKIENCKCNKVSALKDGDIPYIAATSNNNGVLRFVERKEKFITKGNCIVFICDGEGSIGLSIYKSEDFIGTTTVKVGRCRYLNKYTAMFITTVADTVRGKYNFGYKRNERNLKRETIYLPITINGFPDWEFMEQYMRNIETAQILNYLTSITVK